MKCKIEMTADELVRIITESIEGGLGVNVGDFDMRFMCENPSLEKANTVVLVLEVSSP